MNGSQNNNRQPSDKLYVDGETLYAEKSHLKKRNKSLVRVVSIVFALLIALLLLYFAARALFRVNEFSVEGSSHYTSEQIIEACGIDKGRFMFTFSASDVERQIEKKCPYVKEVSVSRDYPSTLNISVVEYEARYYTTEVGKYVVISPELKVLEVTDSKTWAGELIYLELPDISVAVEGRMLELEGDGSSDYIAEFIKALPEYTAEQRITKATLRESYSIKLYCGEGYEVLLGKSDEMPLKLRTLSKVLSSDKLKEHLYARIDVTDPKEPSFVPIDVE